MKILEIYPVIVDIQDNSGYSALHSAAEYNKLDVAEKLIEKVSQFTKVTKNINEMFYRFSKCFKL